MRYKAVWIIPRNPRTRKPEAPRHSEEYVNDDDDDEGLLSPFDEAHMEVARDLTLEHTLCLHQHRQRSRQERLGNPSTKTNEIWKSDW